MAVDFNKIPFTQKMFTPIINHPEFPRGVLVWNMEAIIQMANQRACRLLGYTDDEIHGMHITKILPPPYEIYDPATGEVAEWFWNDGFLTRHVREVKGKGNKSLYVSMLMYAMHDPEGNRRGAYCELDDFRDLIYLDKPMQEIMEKIQGFTRVLRSLSSPLQKQLPASISPAECFVIEHLKNGLTTKEIADRMNLSPKTIDNHRAKIRHKLNVHHGQTLQQVLAQYRVDECFADQRGRDING